VDLDAEVPADHEVRAIGWTSMSRCPPDHEVRAIAAVIDKVDLRGLYADVRARGEASGAPAADPKIRFAALRLRHQ
jgi:transposase